MANEGVRYSLNGQRLASILFDHEIWIWNAGSGAELARFSVAGTVRDISFSPDGGRIATAAINSVGSDSNVRLFDAVSGDELAVLQGHKSPANCIAFSPNGLRMVSGSGEFRNENEIDSDNTVRVWDAQSGAELAVLQGHTKSVLGVSFSRDGRFIVSDSFDQTTRVGDAETFTCREVISGLGDLRAIAAGV